MENRKLLLVDDVNLFLQLEKTFLTRRSFEIHTATNGDEAFQKARAVEPDLIVLDLHMPGMDGDVVCRLLKGDPDTSSIPVIMLSAAQKPEDRKRCLDAGCQAFLTKPVKKDELSHAVEEQLNLSVRDKLRVDVNWPCLVKVGDHKEAGSIRNLSEGGAFLAFDETLHMGSTVRLQFQIPGTSGMCNVSAKVCWSGRLTADGFPGYGISFQVVSAEDLEAIRDHISKIRSGSIGSLAVSL
ncbi:MAG: response regulator [bacterium]|nr:response regulator [bacterium]